MDRDLLFAAAGVKGRDIVILENIWLDKNL